MTLIQSIILGLIQGLTEFIPVSSSGHIYILPNLFGWEINGIDFSNFIIFIHIGTLASLLWVFRSKIWRYIKVLFTYYRSKGILTTKEEKELITVRNIVIAVIPAGILGLLLSDLIDSFYNSRSAQEASILVAIPIIVVGIIFIFEERILKAGKNMHQISIPSALLIGFSQALAFIRGVSRSGITLLSGQLMGLNRVAAAEFSFLMGVPIIAAACIKSLIEILGSNSLTGNDLSIYIAGAISAFFAGNFAIKFMLKFLQSSSLRTFGIYRVIFGTVLILSAVAIL